MIRNTKNNVNSLFDSPLPTTYLSPDSPPKMNNRKPHRVVNWGDCNLLASLFIPDLEHAQEMEQKAVFPNLKPRSTTLQVAPRPHDTSKHHYSSDDHHNNMDLPIVVITHNSNCEKDYIYLPNAIVKGINDKFKIGPRKKQSRFSFQTNAHSA